MAIAAKDERRPEPLLRRWDIDHKHSYVGFEVKHMVFTTVRGVFHDYSGTVEICERDLARSTFEGSIAVASIDTRVRDRDEHLKSADFFDVARFPTITYKSKQIETLGGDRFKVRGDITIRDVTRECVVEGLYTGAPVRDPWGVLRTGFSARGTLNRTDFGLKWNMPLETGGVLVSDSVTLLLDIELVEPGRAP